jgi:hypothetical protein
VIACDRQVQPVIGGRMAFPSGHDALNAMTLHPCRLAHDLTFRDGPLGMDMAPYTEAPR